MYDGISEQEAQQRLERFGPNEIKDETYRSLPRIALAALTEPMVLLLFMIGVLYLFLGEIHEVLSLLSFLLLILIITVFQEHKTEKTLSLLKRLSSPRVNVIRDGKYKQIPGRDLVPGDLVSLKEGDRVPADIDLVKGGPLSVDESTLTGESFPVEKSPSIQGQKRMMSGTLIIRGQGWGEVVATGKDTGLGKIGESLKETRNRPTQLQYQTRNMVNKLGFIVAGLTSFVVLYYGITYQEWLKAVLVGLTLAMAILPNELPAVLLIFLAAGAWRISRRQVLTRKIPAIEALGGITVLCVDKTGTLTQNRMIIHTFWSRGESIELAGLKSSELPENFHEVLEFGILASHPQPFDPMEVAFHCAGQDYLQKTEHLHPEWTLTKEYPMTDQLFAVSFAWRKKQGGGYNIGSKGAPEALIDLCKLPSEETQQIEAQVENMASHGLRVIAVAKAQSDILPADLHQLNFQFMGLVGLTDPIRSDAKAAVKECQEAGIRVMMITGDHPTTALSIGEQVGLKKSEQTLTGMEIDNLSDDLLTEKLKQIHVFCRMRPLHKFRIVKVLQASGEVVAMTGDGVNDAPALSAADIGIAMGERGTDVAREAASIVLLDDNFSSIVAAIRIGRKTFHNLQEAFTYLFAIHVPITAISILPVVFKLPLVLLPIHIAFLHLIIEPVCTILFESDPAGPNMMKLPPRKLASPIISKNRIFISSMHGLWMTTVVMGVFVISLNRGLTPQDARGLTFTTLILTNLALISFYKVLHKRLFLLSFMTIFFLSVVIYVPFFRELFRFEVLHPTDVIICLFAGSITALGFRFASLFKKRGKTCQRNFTFNQTHR